MTNFLLKLLVTTFLVFGIFVAITTTAKTLHKSHTPPIQLQEVGARPVGQTLPNINISVSEVVASGFFRPVQVTHAGDGSGRLFVVGQTGQIQIIQNGTTLPTPFLDIDSLVASGGERGLLSIAFHPNYQNNGYFYVNYTNNSADTVIARYTVSANANIADASSAQILLTIDQPYSNHNGGQLMFGPNNGYLYIGMGDGGSSGDPQNNGQNPNTLLGAMLRIDVDGGFPYAIPPDNPYVGNPTRRDEIWAIGLRNPWRFSFDRANDDLYIGDVGQGAWEEISYQAAGTPGGINFGWRCKEGAHTYNFSGNCASVTLTDPIAEYSHSEGQSVTGGFVYRGSSYPNMQGRYFYADYVTRKVWSLFKTGTGWSTPELEIADTGFNISAFGEDEQGELYIVDHSNGNIRRVADTSNPDPVPDITTSTKNASLTHVEPGQTITYTVLIKNSGARPNHPIYLHDTIPAGLNYLPNSFAASAGTATDLSAPDLYWQGNTTAPVVTLTYQVNTTGQITGTITNQAVITGPTITPLTLTKSIVVNTAVLTSTPGDLFLPGTQPHQLNSAIPDSDSCDTCHTDPVFNTWRGSMMAQAGRDPVFWAAFSVANSDVQGIGEFCLRCHTPKGWLEGRSTPADGAALLPDDIDDGIACEVCHRMVDPVPNPSDETADLDQTIRNSLAELPPTSHPGSAMFIIDPDDNRRGPFSIPTSDVPHSAHKTDFLGQFANDPVTESRLCGTCHNIDNPLLSWDESRNQFWPNQADTQAPSFENGQLFPIERTYTEWLNSSFATPTGVELPKFAGAKADGRVASCQDCHMPRTTGQASDTFPSVQRDCVTTGCLPNHQLVGGNTWVPQLLQDPTWRLSTPEDTNKLNQTTAKARWMLQNAATLTVTLTTNGANKIAAVRVVNDTGHKLPTGYPEGRRMWLNLKAYNATGQLIFESGKYDELQNNLVQTPVPKVYEVKQGITPELASVSNLTAGESFHFVLNNTVIKDNRIPPRGYTQAGFNQPGLRPVGTTYADGQHWDDTTYTLPPETENTVVTLYYQTSSKEYINFLRTNGGIDGTSLGNLWDSSPSPPEIMATASSSPQTVYLPLILKRYLFSAIMR